MRGAHVLTEAANTRSPHAGRQLASVARPQLANESEEEPRRWGRAVLCGPSFGRVAVRGRNGRSPIN